jgi:hypothetical protein
MPKPRLFGLILLLAVSVIGCQFSLLPVAGTDRLFRSGRLGPRNGGVGSFGYLHRIKGAQTWRRRLTIW